MLRANFLLNQGQSLTLEPESHSTGWTGTTNQASVDREVRNWMGRSEPEITCHLTTVRGDLKKKCIEVTAALKRVSELINEEAAALENLEIWKRGKESRKTSREINAKAKMKKLRKAAKAARIRAEAKEQELIDADTDDADTDDMEEEVKTPTPQPPRRSRTQYTPEQQRRLDAQWTFAEFCFVRKFGEQQLKQLRLSNSQVPWVAPPLEMMQSGIPELAAHMLMQPRNINQPIQSPVTNLPPVTQANVFGLSPEEIALRQELAQNGIADLRSHIRVPITRTAPAQENAMGMAIENSGSDSDGGVTPGVASMRVNGS